MTTLACRGTPVETHPAVERWAAFAVGFFLTAAILLSVL
jgi:hypothetical protein